MDMFVRLLSLLCLLATLFTGCVSTYNLRANAAHMAFSSGTCTEALAKIERTTAASRDRLLLLLDRGMILHACGRYEQSNRVLTEAEELADGLTAKSISRESAAALWSEEATEYGGDPHERASIPVIRMLNYLLLDQWDEALIEVRRLATSTERIYGKHSTFDNAFALYLSAMIWEANGQINDAWIDYQKLARTHAELPLIAHDLEAMSALLSLPATLPPKNSLAWKAPNRYRREQGQLLVISESGLAPQFRSEWMTTIFYSFSLPTLMTVTPNTHHARIFVDGQELGSTTTFYHVDRDALRALNERRTRSLTRKLVKGAVQTGLYVAADQMFRRDDIKGDLAGIALTALSLSMSAADAADERSWRTLPAGFGIARFSLPVGEHHVRIVPENGAPPLEQVVTIRATTPTALMIGMDRSATTSKPLTTSTTAHPRTLHDQQTARKRYAAGLELERQGKYSEAARTFAEASALNPEDQEIAGHFMACFEKTPFAFRRSAEGAALAQQFSETLLAH